MNPRTSAGGVSSFVAGRIGAVTALSAVVLAACGVTGGQGGRDAALAPGDEAPGPTNPSDTRRCPEGQNLFAGSTDVREAPMDDSARFPWEVDDPAVVDGFDLNRVISGGPPPDGIPSIDAPCFEPVGSADQWLEDQSPVMTLEVGDEVRAYPLSIMTQHEIVNDVVAGEPLVVTYCPLCNSGLAFKRTVAGTVLDFGTSGRLFQANLVMYDRQTKNLWIQFTGRAVAGEPWAGTELERLATGLVAWGEFKAAHPDGTVLSRDTGFDRSYGRNPYPGYEGRGSRFLFEGPTDDRLNPDARVVGLVGSDDQDPTAVPLEVLRDRRVVDLAVAEEPVTLWWAPGAASALDASEVAGGRDVGQTGAFRPVAPDGSKLTFSVSPDGKRFVDDQTGSTWNILGQAVAGTLKGTTLEEMPRDDTFWFVWFSFRPETEIVGAGGAS